MIALEVFMKNKMMSKYLLLFVTVYGILPILSSVYILQFCVCWCDLSLKQAQLGAAGIVSC